MTEWKMVPVKPTEAMKRAAVVFANGNAVYRNVAAEALTIEEDIYGEAYAAMLAAAPPAPSAGAESVEWLMQRCEEYQSRAHEAERAHRTAPTPDTGASMAPDAMRLALEWLENEQRAADEDCGAPECDECQSVTRPRQRVVDALRAALRAG